MDFPIATFTPGASRAVCLAQPIMSELCISAQRALHHSQFTNTWLVQCYMYCNSHYNTAYTQSYLMVFYCQVFCPSEWYLQSLLLYYLVHQQRYQMQLWIPLPILLLCAKKEILERLINKIDALHCHMQGNSLPL